MFTEEINNLWNSRRSVKTREALVDTLILCLNMELVFTEEQLVMAINFMTECFQVTDDATTLSYLRNSVSRVNKWGYERAIAQIAKRTERFSKVQKETVLKLAIVAYHFSAPVGELLPMDESVLPELSVALDGVDSIEKILSQIRNDIKSFKQNSHQPVTAGEMAPRYYAMGDYDKAVMGFTEVLEADPSNVDVYIRRGAAYSKLGQLDKALADYKMALDLSPGHPLGHYNIACLAAKQGDVDTLIPHLCKAVHSELHNLVIGALLTDADFDPVRHNPRFQESLVKWQVLSRVIQAEELLPDTYCSHCHSKGTIYKSRIQHQDVKVDFYRCEKCGDSHPAAVFGKRVLIWHTRKCPKCRRSGIFYLGSLGTPSCTGQGEVIHRYRCAHPDCLYEWHKEV